MNQLKLIQLTQMLELANKTIKTNITIFLKTQIEFLEIKTKMSRVKNIPDWINSRLNITNEMISALEDKENKLSKIRQEDTKKELKKNEKSISELWYLAHL